MKTHSENKCSNCGNILDAAEPVSQEGAVPKEGDVCVCAYCGQIGVYDSETKVRKMHEHEMYALFKEQPDLANIVLEIQSVFAFMSENKPETNN